MLRLGEELDPGDGRIRMWVDLAVAKAKKDSEREQKAKEEEAAGG
jgi:hypothetical protein